MIQSFSFKCLFSFELVILGKTKAIITIVTYGKGFSSIWEGGKKEKVAFIKKVLFLLNKKIAKKGEFPGLFSSICLHSIYYPLDYHTLCYPSLFQQTIFVYSWVCM